MKLLEDCECDNDDIYPSILKNKSSFYKRFLSKIYWCWLGLWHKVFL